MFIPAHSEIAGYQLGEKIGTGGMGEVYSAWHPILRRKAAVKVLHKIEHTERFRQEAYIQSSVDHPHITRLFEFTYTGKTPCIIMEYVEGEPLDSYLNRQGRLESTELIKLLAQITDALAYLHEREIFHRDIKPSNFKRLPDGSIKMLDFGIAKHKYSPRLTQQGFVVGTTEYMAPEQFEQQADLRSDIWSLGVMTYELATGYLPFEATNPVTLRARISKGSFSNPRLFVPDLHEIIRQVIEQCLRINPAQRSTAAQLQALLTGKERTKKNGRKKLTVKRPVLLSVIAGLAIILLIGLLNAPDGQNEPDPPGKPVSGSEKKAAERSITINVPGVEHAELVFPDGSRQSAPYSITGKDGEPVRFRIEAAGYQGKEVAFDLRMGPYTYEFVLEKINNE
jgi:eukaryotic-like serine/threonine-protein kinase